MEFHMGLFQMSNLNTQVHWFHLCTFLSVGVKTFPWIDTSDLNPCKTGMLFNIFPWKDALLPDVLFIQVIWVHTSTPAHC